MTTPDLPPVPISRPLTGTAEESAVAAVLRSGWLTQGPVVESFENSVAERVGARHAVATTSATTALQATLLALGVRPGDEVICPSFTYIATPNSIVHAGAEPVFADVDAETWSLDPRAVEAAITPRTVGIMPVHLGYPVDLGPFRALAAKHGVFLVEDAAPALGAVAPDGRAVGNSSGPVVFSFHPRKVVTTGEGGMVTTDDDDIARTLRLLRHHYMGTSDVERHRTGGLVFESYQDVGHNWRMTDLQGAVGMAQMSRLTAILDERATIAASYDDAFRDLPGARRRRLVSGGVDSHQHYALHVGPGQGRDRGRLMSRLQTKGIATRRGIMSCHREEAHAARRVPLPVSEDLSDRTLLLPLFAGMSSSERDRVVDAVLGEWD